MKTFIIKVCIYSVITISILYLFPLAVFFISKDYLPIKKMVETQAKHPEALIGFSYYGGQSVVHKMLLLERIHPNVLAFGSSGAFQISKIFFNKPDEFVNIAVPRPSLGNLINLKDFITALPNDGNKRIMIFYIEKRFFTENYESSSDKNGDSFILKFSHLVGKPLRVLYLDYLSRKYSFLDFVKKSYTTDDIGLWSLVRDSGYRIDGSLREEYEMRIPNRKDILASDIEGRVKNIRNYNSTLLSQEEKIIPGNLEALKSILELCKERNITVVAFIPAAPVAVAKEIEANKSLYAQMQTKLTRDLATIFSSYNYSFFDLSDTSLYGGKDSEFLDLTHGGDLLYAKILLYLAEHDNTLRSAVNVKGIQMMIKNSKGDFLNF